MYLKKTYKKESGRTYLAIAQKYRHPVKKVSTDRTVKSLGYLDELEKKYDDPIAYFKKVARKMTEEDNAKKGDLLLVQGDFGATVCMISFAKKLGIVPIYATTCRKVEERVEGDRIITLRHFEHVRFRRYETDCKGAGSDKK